MVINSNSQSSLYNISFADLQLNVTNNKQNRCNTKRINKTDVHVEWSLAIPNGLAIPHTLPFIKDAQNMAFFHL